MSAANLQPEWQRIDLLAACVADCRRGVSMPADVQDQLQAVSREVMQLRQGSPWADLISRHGLEPLDQDIICCSLAPEAEPQIGWIFQELQPGLGSPYPTPALLQELLFLDDAEARLLRTRLAEHSPLTSAGLIERGAANNSYVPVRPTATAQQQLLGRNAQTLTLPGAIEVNATATLDDLVLPQHCLRALREYLIWITHRDKVVDEWGGDVRGGPIALFSGPSGTGKTFSAEVIANMLDWRLFRVDLGLLVSKYIGETEKNLNALFDAADGQPLVLLFDEADSLFAKRGEVREARDRYANMEVSHLLSRIERHTGPCILTSNLRQQIDSAFARRFQSVIEFPMPDAAARTDLWRQYLPARAPLAERVEPEILGAATELSGGQIKNAATQAAFLAADDDVAIDLEQIAWAVYGELAKEGREVFRSGLGVLGDHLPEGVGT